MMINRKEVLFMKEQYQELEAEVIRFEAVDVITDSNNTETPIVTRVTTN